LVAGIRPGKQVLQLSNRAQLRATFCSWKDAQGLVGLDRRKPCAIPAIVDGILRLETPLEGRPNTFQPARPSEICLLGTNCEAHEGYLIETLKFSDQNIGFQELLRGAASGLGALGVGGRENSARALFDVGIPSRDPTRAPVALAVATIALRNSPLMLSVLKTAPAQSDAIALLAEGFDMLEEDFDKERFFALVRRTYWDSADGSADRKLMQTLIGKLDF